MVVFLLWRQLHPRFQATQDLVSAPFLFLLSLSNVCIVVVTECPGLEEVLVVIVVYSFMLLVGKAVSQPAQHLITLITQVTLDLYLDAVLVRE